ncbi:endonuclease/exonuclease/phosphatase family protein [Nocardioides mangrovi]|uniref:Endonuclease/exonuclease/phosphatase family protein n=1 Tax=Nocardioides mangrovi TaxID=2874580 RepID=A0ABS7U997_9ACTN|nr:endonuclease/exonuclease/phosphatase family protein [Nocardioides mangrovi]MBZ5737301.1 endonuclease/exonuclease/phosphatase family protein [Nocardioides mangrovi]
MSRHAHRAPQPAGRRLTTLLTILIVASLGTAVFAAIRLSGSGDETTTDGARVAAADLGGARTKTPAAGASRAAASIAPASDPQPVVQARTLVKKPQVELVRKAAQRTARKAEEEPTAPFDLTIGTFNVLGSQHTGPGGERSRYPAAATRSVGAANLMIRHGVDIVGTQETQPDQLAALTSRTGLTAWPGTAWGSTETDNSILYDASRFTFVSGSSFTITFMSHPHPQPILRLEDNATGREFYVVNTHPSAGAGRYTAERQRGRASLVAVVNNLRAESGLPVFVTGDMNDRELFYCNVVPQASLTAPNGGSYASGCVPPRSPIPVDWVVGSSEISWSGYWRDTSPVTNRISDHYFISATAHVE